MRGGCQVFEYSNLSRTFTNYVAGMNLGLTLLTDLVTLEGAPVFFFHCGKGGDLCIA